MCYVRGEEGQEEVSSDLRIASCEELENVSASEIPVKRFHQEVAQEREL